MNEDYASLREHTIDDIRQVIDFFRLEIDDTAEMHNTIERSLSEMITDWVPMEFEQIEITSSSMGDNFILSVIYTNTSGVVDDQFCVVHHEVDVFDNTTLMLKSIMDSGTAHNGTFGWMEEAEDVLSSMPLLGMVETSGVKLGLEKLDYDLDDLEFTLDELEDTTIGSQPFHI